MSETAKLRKLITKRGTLEILIPLCCTTNPVRHKQFKQTMKGFSTRTLSNSGFFDAINMDKGTKFQERCNTFAYKGRSNSNWAFNNIIRFPILSKGKSREEGDHSRHYT